jgi:hypothetical protein
MRVHAVLAGAVDTDMTRGFDSPKASLESVARAIFDGVENGEEEEIWRSGPGKALEREYAALVGGKRAG